MHIGEAIMPRPDAIARAREALQEALARNDRYYTRVPGSRPVPERVLEDRITADDTWIFVPFAREDAAQKPIVVRVNGITKAAAVDAAF